MVYPHSVLLLFYYSYPLFLIFFNTPLMYTRTALFFFFFALWIGIILSVYLLSNWIVKEDITWFGA